MENKTIVYEIGWILERIYTVSDRVRNKLTDQSLFEERCIERVANYLNVCESHRRNKRYIERLINEVASAVLTRNRNEHAEIFSELSKKDEDGEELEFEPEDVLADVEKEVMAKEMTALLAQDDHRKKIILGNWITGNDNVSDIARLLAQTIGGPVETHRKYIHRFRKECRKFIAA